MRAIVIGPGKIGCGYLVPLFRDAGWDVLLAARTAERAERILAAGGFSVRITGSGVTREFEDVRAVATGTPAFDEAVASADLVVTAVGVRHVPGLGPTLARALSTRDPRLPLQVWVVENQDCAPVLEKSVGDAAARARLPLPPVGFAGAVAEVAVSRGDWHGAERPVFVGDPIRRLRVDRSALIAPLPRLPAVEPTPCYRVRLQEKLFVFNAGHALCAYLGVLRGHRSIDAAVRDRFLRPLVAGSMLEAARAISSAYPGLNGDLHASVAKVMRRFEDDELADPVERVARDPLRKLQPNDRLVGAAKLVRATLGHVPHHFALGIAGALLYRHEQDEEAVRLAGMLERHGLAHVLGAVCGLPPDDELARAVAQRYRGFILTRDRVLFPPVYESRAAMLDSAEAAR
jgi:mannitol-1-phosphate 5-dehydrogenase